MRTGPRLHTRTTCKSGGNLVYVFGAVILFRVTVFSEYAQLAKKASIVRCGSMLISMNTYAFDNLYCYSYVMWAVQSTSLVKEPNLIHLQLPLKCLFLFSHSSICTLIPCDCKTDLNLTI